MINNSSESKENISKYTARFSNDGKPPQLIQSNQEAMNALRDNRRNIGDSMG
jgi:hypothetical protein